MRALYFPDLKSLSELSNELIIEGSQFHHLINVTRAKVGDNILLLDGKGRQGHCIIAEVLKRKAIVNLSQISFTPRNFELSLALCIPKRDALDLCLKQAVEIGIRHIYLVESDFTVNNKLKNDRIDRLLESAVEQANNPYLVSYSKVKSLRNIPFKDFDKTFCLTSQEESTFKGSLAEKQKLLMLIGPEGGFSNGENVFLDQVLNLDKLKLETHILRTPTAVSVASGYLLGMFQQY